MVFQAKHVNTFIGSALIIISLPFKVIFVEITMLNYELCALSWLKVPQALLVEGDYQLTFCLQENLFRLKSQDKGNKILKVNSLFFNPFN